MNKVYYGEVEIGPFTKLVSLMFKCMERSQYYRHGSCSGHGKDAGDSNGGRSKNGSGNSDGVVTGGSFIF